MSSFSFSLFLNMKEKNDIDLNDISIDEKKEKKTSSSLFFYVL